MIVSIEKPHPSCKGSIDYNERKVMMGTAELVAYANLPGSSREEIYGTFSDYEKTRYLIRNLSFHASVNPSDADNANCSEDDYIAFITDMMSHLGYGQQPFLIYRHDDIERTHYHVISVRADKDGRKISDLYEKKRAAAFMRSVAAKYGFEMAERSVKTEESLARHEGRLHRKRFQPGGRDTAQQLREVFEFALGYDFDGDAQLSCVLESLGVRATLHTTDKSPYFVLQGLDDKGHPVTDVMSESRLGVRMYEQCMMASIANKQGHHLRAREKERLRGLVSAAFRYSKSEQHFENILRNKGVGVFLSKNIDGEVFGITFVDHRTKSVFKASEIRDVISVALMRQAVESGRWRKEDRGSARCSYIRQSRAEARKEAIALRDLKAGVIARIIHPVGQPSGNSWSGRSRMSDEQKEQERDQKRKGGLVVSLEDDRFVENLE